MKKNTYLTKSSITSKKSITILICALNEEKNIGFLLQDILDQYFSEKIESIFNIQQIIVISDGSKDRTTKIVKDFSRKDNRIQLIENKHRIGKIYSMDKAIKNIDTNYMILFDADVRLERKTISKLMDPLQNASYALVAGNPIPNKPKSFLNIAEQASYFSWKIHQEIKKRQPQSIYSAHGRILCLSKKLYKHLDISCLSTPGDDQFIYIKSNHNFCYESKAIVNYIIPASIGDYLKQNIRFRTAKHIKENLFSNEYIKNEFKINKQVQILINIARSNPYKFCCWISLYFIGYSKYKLLSSNLNKANTLKVWDEVTSTK
jgi:glycosyltransferase involved in cell wall biosynthesis